MATRFPQVVPYLYYPDANEALEFLTRAFGFEEESVTRDDDGKVWTAQLSTGSALVMIGPALSEFGTRPVSDHEWATCRVHVLVDDLDGHYRRAVSEGAVVHAEPAAHFGDVRIYVAGDCGGQQWIFSEPPIG